MPKLILPHTLDGRLIVDRARKKALRRKLKAAGIKETTVYGRDRELTAWHALAVTLNIPFFSPSKQLERAQHGEDGAAVIAKIAESARKKSKAPARVASTASAMVPWPEIMTAGARESLCRSQRRTSMPLASGSIISSRKASARRTSGWARNSEALRQTVTA